MSFPQYYQSELAYYRSLAQEYARRFPEVAHMLGERGTDGAVERLLQGAALLSGRLRFRVDDDLPEVVQGLFRRMWPQHIRPLPAMTMLKLRSASSLSTCTTLDPGVRVKSRPLAGSLPLEPTFRTTGKVDVQPLAIKRARLDPAHPADLQLKIELEAKGGASLSGCGLKRFRFQLVGDDDTRFALYFWLTRFAERVSLRDESGKAWVLMPTGYVKPGGLSSDEPLIPSSPTPLPGFRLLWEYFVCRDKFLAIEVGDFEIPRGTFSAGKMELVFHLGKPPGARPSVSADNFALGCTPALNVGNQLGLELPVEQGTSSYGIDPKGIGEIFSVDRVGCSHKDTGEWVEFVPFFSSGRLRLLDDRPCYQVVRFADSVEGVRVYLQITGQDGNPISPPSTTLNVWVTETDGSAPVRLPAGAVCVSTSETPGYVSVENISPVFPAEAMRVGQDLRWSLLAQLTMHPDDLASENGLNGLIRSAAPERSGEPPEVLSVQTQMTGLLHKRTMVPVRIIIVEVDESQFHGAGGVALFATIINEVFARSFDSTVFNQLAVRGRSTGLTIQFPPH